MMKALHGVVLPLPLLFLLASPAVSQQIGHIQGRIVDEKTTAVQDNPASS